MTLASTDLNLLRVLKVILEEGNLTRAGRRLGLSQPAMSGVLARLRRRFDDELLVRLGREYVLSPFAVDLLPEVQEAVRRMTEAFQLEKPFEPESSTRTFRFTMSDYAISVLHEALLAKIAQLAPRVQVHVEPLDPAASSSERVLMDFDVVVAPLGYGFPGEARPLWRDRIVCIVDPANPRLSESGTLSLNDLSALPHAVGSFGAGTLTPADRVLAECGVRRRRRVDVAGYLPLPFVVEGSDMVALLPERLARLHCRPLGPLLLVEPPFGNVDLAEGYYFAPSRCHDASYRWLLERLDEVGSGLAESAGTRS